MEVALLILGIVLIPPFYLIIYINSTIRKNDKITKTR